MKTFFMPLLFFASLSYHKTYNILGSGREVYYPSANGGELNNPVLGFKKKKGGRDEEAYNRL
jgi:hypothetical protein